MSFGANVGLGGGNVPLFVQHDTQRRRVAGRLVDGAGNPKFVDGAIANVEEFTDATSSSDRGGTSFGLSSGSTTGTFQIDLAPDVSTVRVQLRIGSGAVVDIPLDVNRDTTVDVGNYAYVDRQTVRVGGTWNNGYTVDPVTGNGVEIVPQQVRIVLTPYAVDPANDAQVPAYTATGAPFEVTVTADGDLTDANGGIDNRGDFVGRMTLPAGTTAVSVKYYVDGDPVAFGGKGFGIDPRLAGQLLHRGPFYGAVLATTQRSGSPPRSASSVSIAAAWTPTTAACSCTSRWRPSTAPTPIRTTTAACSTVTCWPTLRTARW